MFVIGRGIEFATAREIALKLLETCRVAAEPLTATELAHGPVAALDPLFPVWAIASDDETLPAVVEAAERIRAAGATLVASGDAADAIAGAAYVLPCRSPPSPLLSPLLSVVPGQLFAWALAHAKGLDPDRPGGLSKVTLATLSALRGRRRGELGQVGARRRRPGSTRSRRSRSHAGSTLSCAAARSGRAQAGDGGCASPGWSTARPGFVRYSSNLGAARRAARWSSSRPEPVVFANDLVAAPVGEADGGTLALLQAGHRDRRAAASSTATVLRRPRASPERSATCASATGGLRCRCGQQRLRRGLRRLGRSSTATRRRLPSRPPSTCRAETSSAHEAHRGDRLRGGGARRRVRPRHAADRRRARGGLGRDAARGRSGSELRERVLPDVAAATAVERATPRRLGRLLGSAAWLEVRGDAGRDPRRRRRAGARSSSHE